MQRRPFRDGLLTLEPLSLVGTTCPNCGQMTFPVRSVCPWCHTEHSAERMALPTNGTVYTFTIVRQAPAGEEVPYVLGYVDLPGDVRLMSRITASSPEEVDIGMEVRLAERAMGTDVDGAELVGYQFVPGRS